MITKLLDNHQPRLNLTNYFADNDAEDDKLSIKERYSRAFKYIKEHGNSFWAKVDYVACKIRWWLYFIIFIVLLALFVGWRPW